MKLKILTLALTLAFFWAAPVPAGAQPEPAPVFFTKDISPAGLQKVYEALGRPATGKVGVKLSVGEPGNPHYLAPALIGDLVRSVGGTFIDGNTAYGGRRGNVADHLKAAEDHGFTAVAPVVILDAGGEVTLPIQGGTHLKEVPVGAHFRDYDFLMVLSHFKGHSMGGFGGALKNISIGIASPAGKALIHTAGRSSTNMMDGPDQKIQFIEAMAEAAAGMIAAVGPEKALYISVMNNLSVDCDCASNPAKPEMHDIGILGSLDPVALDQACVDLVYQADDQESAALRVRIESRQGAAILPHAEKMGLGRREYQLVSLD